MYVYIYVCMAILRSVLGCPLLESVGISSALSVNPLDFSSIETFSVLADLKVEMYVCMYVCTVYIYGSM